MLGLIGYLGLVALDLGERVGELEGKGEGTAKERGGSVAAVTTQPECLGYCGRTLAILIDGDQNF